MSEARGPALLLCVALVLMVACGPAEDRQVEPDYPCTLYIYGSYDQHKHEAKESFWQEHYGARFLTPEGKVYASNYELVCPEAK